MSKGKTDNFSMRIYLETIQYIVGSNGLKSILNYAHLEKYIDSFPPDNDMVEVPLEDLRIMCHSLLEILGPGGARSLQLLIGRENVRRGLLKRPQIAKAIRLACHFVPETKKMRVALEKLIETSKQRYTSEVYEPHERIELLEEKDCFIIIERESWESEDVFSQNPVCDIYVGTIEALIEWVTGHLHEVKEVECRAVGHPCDVFRIAKARSDL
ncbi:MAG: hypothetical protein HXS44_01975 [Theionarchaea archaeon]|nr:hypothetical protein [Theionarchaea archaeon]